MDPAEDPERPPDGVGVKYDQDKPRLDLIPGDALLELGQVFSFGAKKYAPNNWRNGLQYSRLQAALLRHYVAWSEGEERDPEGNFHHLAAVAWCAMCLMTMQKIHPEMDDRPSKPSNQEALLNAMRHWPAPGILKVPESGAKVMGDAGPQDMQPR